MLKEPERGQGWDSNPGPLDLSPRSPDCPMPGSWGYPSAVGRNPRGRKPSSAEPPNPSASRTAAEPVRQHQIPTQAPAHPWPAHAARSAVTLPTATFPGLSNDQHRLRVPCQLRRSLTTKAPVLLSLQKLWLLRGPKAAGDTCRSGRSLSRRASSLPRSRGGT